MIAPLGTSDVTAFQQRIRKDPAFYCKEYLGVRHWWDGMYRMLGAIPRAIEERKPVVVGSGHALSKDFTVSGCVPLWFMHAYGPSAICVMTAPSDRQVRSVMWGELRGRYNDRPVADQFGDLKVCELKIEDKWYVIAFTTKESHGAVGRFQGFHANALCVITSEAQAIEDTIFEQIDGVMTSPVALQIHLGNPLRTTGHYARMLKDTTNNIVITLDCHDSPNYKEKKTVVPGMVTYEWVEDKRKKWGESDPRFVSRVLGQVPRTSVNTVISEELYDKCIDRGLLTAEKRGAIGVDPARYGDDDMIISVFESGRLIDEIRLPFCDAPSACSHILAAQKRHFPEGQIAIVVDCDGLGGPYLDFLRTMAADELDIQFIEVHGCSTNKEEIQEDYANLRAQMAFHAKSEMEAGRISLDNDRYAKEEALEEEYFVNLRGKLQLEAKEDIKERLGRSPDRWDARKLGIWGLQFAGKIKTRDRWRERKSGMAPVGSHMAS